MCNFFSLISNGKGKIYYFDWKLREKCLKKELDYSPDSHTSIADYFNFKGKEENKVNKYEYNPLTKKFQIDQINTVDDSKEVEKQCQSLNFKKIIPQLIIKPIVNPFLLPERKKVTKKDIVLLKQWASVGASMWGSVWASVWDSLGDSLGASVRASVWVSVGASVGASVRDSVRASVGASVRDSVRASVRASVWASVWDSVWAYINSFFNIYKETYPFQCIVDLWNKGLVPSYDGKTWRLHTGKEAKIIYEWKI